MVEDEPLVAQELVARLRSIGCQVLGPATSLGAARRLLDRETPAAALLDVKIRGQNVSRIAKRLAETGVPFAVVTGFPRLASEHEVLRTAPILTKPVTQRDIERTLRSLLSRWPP